MNDMRRLMKIVEGAETVDSSHAELGDHYRHSPHDAKTLQGLTRDARDLNRHLHAQYARNQRIPDQKRTRQLDAAIAAHETPYAFDVYTGAAHDVKPGIYHHAAICIRHCLQSSPNGSPMFIGPVPINLIKMYNIIT